MRPARTTRRSPVRGPARTADRPNYYDDVRIQPRLRAAANSAENTKTMINGATLDMYVFFLAFASAFLLGGKRPFLAISTRATLVVLLALALAYAAGADQWYRAYVGVAALIVNALFVAFAVIDFIGWQKKRLPE